MVNTVTHCNENYFHQNSKKQGKEAGTNFILLY